LVAPLLEVSQPAGRTSAEARQARANWEGQKSKG